MSRRFLLVMFFMLAVGSVFCRSIKQKKDTLCLIIFPSDSIDISMSIRPAAWDSCLQHLFVHGTPNNYTNKFLLRFNKCTPVSKDLIIHSQIYSIKMLIEKVKTGKNIFLKGHVIIIGFAKTDDFYVIKYAEATYSGAHPPD